MYFSINFNIGTMKKLVFLLTALVVISCKEDVNKPEYVILNGTVQNSDAETAMIRGFDMEFEMPISAEGTFSDTLYIKKDGLYEFYVGRERTPTYLVRGNNFSISVDAVQFDESISYSGDAAAENNYLAAKYLLSEKEKPFQEVYSMEEADFLNEANAINKTYQEHLANTQGLSEAFVAMENENLGYEHAMNLEKFQEYHRYYAGNETFTVSEGFYDYSKNINFADTIAFRNSQAYQGMLNVHISRLVSEASSLDPNFNMATTYLNLVDKNLPDGFAKDQLMYGYLRYGLTPDAGMEEVYNVYKNSNPNAENLQKVTERYSKLKPLLPGNPSPNFDYENHKGGTTKLADLKGKYVYVDVWATWCGPCIREIPSLKQVEKDYHGKNIVFVSLSIDEAKDHDKWKAMVTEKELGGIQLMADKDWKSQFVEDYGILGIPRFILIDPQGNIVSADAPRPSEAKLRTMLDKLI